MKLQIKTTFDFGKLASKTEKLIDGLVQKTTTGKASAMKNRISSGSTITGKMEALKDSTMETRKLRGISGSVPLKATGALLNSIKPTAKGIMAKEYGSYHNTEFVTQNNPAIPDSPIYSGKNGKGSKRFKFKGKTIPARRWLHDSDTFKHDKKIIDSFFTSIGKALKK